MNDLDLLLRAVLDQSGFEYTAYPGESVSYAVVHGPKCVVEITQFGAKVYGGIDRLRGFTALDARSDKILWIPLRDRFADIVCEAILSVGCVSVPEDIVVIKDRYGMRYSRIQTRS